MVTSQMKNHYSESQMVFFDMYIPKDAFVSNFSMIIKEKIYVANVETKEKAKTIFENSNTNAGLVQNHEKSDFKETEHVRLYESKTIIRIKRWVFSKFQIAFSAKVDPYDKVVFELTYEQPLERVMGLNNYKLHLNLKNQIIDDFKIKVNMSNLISNSSKFINEIPFQVEDSKKCTSLLRVIFFYFPSEDHYSYTSYSERL